MGPCALATFKHVIDFVISAHFEIAMELNFVIINLLTQKRVMIVILTMIYVKILMETVKLLIGLVMAIVMMEIGV